MRPPPGAHFSFNPVNTDHTLPAYVTAVLNRLTLHSEAAAQMHVCELAFEPYGKEAQRDREAGTEAVLLRARRELLDADAKWCVPRSLRRPS